MASPDGGRLIVDATKTSGRSALSTPTTALSKVRDPKHIGNAANVQPAADEFAGTVLRSMRRFVELRIQKARPARCLKELATATDALSSASWAVEYEAGLRDRGER